MRRGELYRVMHPTSLDPRRQRVFAIVSLVSLAKSQLTDYVGSLSPRKMLELDQALALAVGLVEEVPPN